MVAGLESLGRLIDRATGVPFVGAGAGLENVIVLSRRLTKPTKLVAYRYPAQAPWLGLTTTQSLYRAGVNLFEPVQLNWQIMLKPIFTRDKLLPKQPLT